LLHKNCIMEGDSGLFMFVKCLLTADFNMKGFKLVIVLFCLFQWNSSLAGTFLPSYPAVRIILSPDSPKDTSRINNLTRAGLKYIYQKEMVQKAKACIDTAVLICKKENIEIPALLNLLKAEYSFSSGDYRNASDLAMKTMEQAKSAGEENVLVRTMYFLGRYYFRTGLFKESLEYYSNGITLANKYGLKGIIPKCYEGQANTYIAIDDVKEYQQSLQNLINAAFAENDTLSLERGYYLLGTSFLEKNRNFRLADSLLRRCFEISLIKKDADYLAQSLANIGWNFYLEKNYDSSLAYYNKSLKYSLREMRYSTAANSYGNIGTIYRDIGYPDKSIIYYLNAIDQAKKVNDWYSLSWVYKDMSDMYLRIKDTSKAFNSFVLHKHFSDSLLINKNTQGLTNARLRYETDTHNKEVELLSLRIKNQRLMIYGFSAFIVLTLAIGLLLFRGSKLKAKRRISEMNRKISEITQANLRQQMNPHFIFNTLNSIQYYMYQHDKLATNNYLTKFSSLMRKVLENSQHTSITIHDELDALNLYLELECIRFKDKFDYKINVDEEIDPLLFKVPTMLIQPFVENSICHGLMPGEGKGFIKIDLKLERDYISCTIEDNGIGREAAQKRKTKSGNNHNSLGTQIVASRLDLVNALYSTSLKTIYTDLKNKDGDPEGTRVEIHIPIIT
jgi:tetratricopeptide (TPR) repeat protein